MGMIRRSTMPLLSTLAALVIIVHSQEEMERGYRHDLRPRVVDTSSYEQPWKAIDMEPLVHQHSTRAEVWNESPEVAPARRRPVRKRKRRPLPYPDAEPQERHQESIQGTYHDIDYHDSQQTIETTRRRRKRPDINYHLTEEPTNQDERPLRRRGLRRKRPIDYDVQMSELISPEPGDDFRSEKRINNFSKYNQFDEYDEAERNTENTKVYLRVETDNLANRLKTLINNAENTDLSGYNRTFGVEEQRKLFGVSNIRFQAAEPESSSAVDENERLKTTHQIKHPTEQSKDDNADIMVMLKKSKVKNLKLGIIINGTEQSYLPLPIPAHEAYADYDDSLTMTQKSNDAAYSGPNEEERTFFNSSDEEEKDIVVNHAFKNNTLKSNRIMNGSYGNKDKNYLHFLLAAQNNINAGAVSLDNSKISKNLFQYVTKEPEYINLPISAKKVIAISGANKKSTGKSNGVISLSHGIKKPKYNHHLPSGAEKYVPINSVSIGNAEKSLSYDGTEPNYINLPLLSQNVVAIYELPKNNKEISDTKYDSDKLKNGHSYFPLPTPVNEGFANDAYLKNDTDISNSILDTKNANKQNKYISFTTPTNKVISNNAYSEDHTGKSNSVVHFGNAGKGVNYIPLPRPEVEAVVDKGHSKYNTNKSNSAFNLANFHNEHDFFSLPRPVITVYTNMDHSRDITENSNSVFNLGNREKEYNYFPLPKPVPGNFDNAAYFTDNSEKSNLGINLSSAQNASDSTEKTNEPLAEYGHTEKVMNTTNGAYSGNDRVKYSKGRSENDMIFPKKWINTNKWIAKIKLQIPRLTPAEINEFEAIQAEYEENGVIDPMMLKQILKRSNGSSLSEMLQRHNLSLADLLQGKDEAISALNAEASGELQLQLNDASLENSPRLKEAESKYPTRQQSSPELKVVGIESNSDEETIDPTTEILEAVTDTTDAAETETPETNPRMSAKRRFPTGIRRKLRMRPMLNSTLKAQLSRDLIAMSARKYSRNNKNATKSREWKDIVPLMVDRSKTNDEASKDDATEPTPTTTEAPADTTVANIEISNSSYSVSNISETGSVKENEIENTTLTTTEPTSTIIIEVSPSELTERPKITPIVRPSANNSALRRQAFNNRLKRKRLKQKSSTTENPNDDLMKNFLGMANLVSASHFIERTQKPYTTINQDNTDFATELEDFLTTQQPKKVDGDAVKSTEVATTRLAAPTTNVPQTSSTSTTEQSAKFEIEEILNDTMTSERLAKILRERNMTLSELVNHRERGSSHVHLADIFHNASKEPNPPEPFLTKSSIEPISKETYPLRAILEANTHETTTRSTSSHDNKNSNIPVVMDFGNNVNENGESMGIISLFNKFTDSDLSVDNAEIQQDSDGTPYVSSVISVNATNATDTNRESRVLTDNEDWKILLSFMKEHNISTFEEDLQALNKGDPEKESLDEDLDGDGLMVLEDVQHLQTFDSNIASGLDKNVEVNMYERRENLSDTSGILNKIPDNTKSVAIATASILGLAAILFLLTYIAFKWKQQRDKLRNKLRKKESFCGGPIPSPVFENRKGHKHNCSSRSISPMISNTNIYMSTLDSRNGNESPDYTWNSLRKPFQ